MTTEVNNQKQSGSGVDTYLLVPIFLFFILLIFAVIRSPSLISSAGIGSAIIVVAPLVLATYALTAIVMAGRGSVDLSIGPLLGFINVSLIQLTSLGAMESPITAFLFAIAAGIGYQVLMGLVIVYVRVQPIIVSLSGYLSLVGLNLVILPRPGGLAPEWMLSWGAGTTIFSPVLAILVLATIGWYILARTSFWGHLRLMGSDERTAYTSGVQINIVRIGAHAIGGIYAGLAAITFTSLISSGDPSQGTTYTLMAVTALVLGGANLAGGRGGAFGSLLGALNIYLVTYVLATFNFGTLQSFVTDLAFGLMLVISLLISLFVPELQRRIRGVSPLVFFVVMSIPALGVIINRTRDKAQGAEKLLQGSSGTFTSASDLAAQTTSTGGTTFFIVVIGMVIVISLVSVIIKMKNITAFGFAAVLITAALGLIFNNTESKNPVDGVAEVSSETVASVNEPFFPMEVAKLSSTTQSGELLLSSFAYGVIWLATAVLLASFFILVALPQVSARVKKISLWWLATGMATFVLGGLFLFGQESGQTGSLMLEDLHIVLFVALGLFALSGPLVQTPIKNISQLYIIVLCVLAVGSVYFFSGTNAQTTNEAPQNYAASIIIQSQHETTKPKVYPLPSRIEASSENQVAVVSQLSFSLLLIVMMQYFVGRAMGITKFENFWPYAYIVVLTIFGGGAFFYSIGTDLWKILVVLLIGIPSTPIVLHIVKTYRERQGGHGGSSNWSSYGAETEEAS